ITNKLIHAPTTGLKQASADGRQDLIHHARRLLGLEVEPQPPETVDEREQVEVDLPMPTVKTTRRTLQ
ncbi:MAG: glutamyl-tRNA reductase, partial [Halioglobus sp.]|nr:glutamyl-tRNA reductase [Halioglobus sp.]